MPDQKGMTVIPFISGLLLIVIAIGAFLYMRNYDRKTKKEIQAQAALQSRPRSEEVNYYDRFPLRQPGTLATWIKLLPIAPLLLGCILIFVSMFTVVPTKDIGVVTAFGAPVDAMHNGPHLKAPWQDVTLMDGAIQTDTHNKGTSADCVQVRIAHQIVACANTYVKWQIKEGGVDTLFQNYREFGNIRDSLVDKNLQSVLNKIFESYDPLSVDAKTGQSNAPELSVLSAQALASMKAAVGSQVNVPELAVTVLNYDDATQRKINDLQGQVAQTRIAQQAVQTAEQQAEANKVLATSVSKDPNVLVSKCLDHLADAIANKYPLPAGFTCWPGASNAVVVPGGATPAK